MIDIKVITSSSIGTNMYLVTDIASGKKCIVDCPPIRSRQIEFLKLNAPDGIEFILLTHGHFDHILGLGDMLALFGGKIIIHAADADCLHDREKALCRWEPAKALNYYADRTVADGDEIHLGESVFKVLHTPGHTEGSVCYLCGDTLFSGDTLFKETCGRVDFPGGDGVKMKNSLQRLSALADDLRVLPGHNEETTLIHERKYNPYM